MNQDFPNSDFTSAMNSLAGLRQTTFSQLPIIPSMDNVTV